MQNDRVIEVAPLIEYLKDAQHQAAMLFKATGNLMWVGETIAYQHIIEAIELGSVGEPTA